VLGLWRGFYLPCPFKINSITNTMLLMRMAGMAGLPFSLSAMWDFKRSSKAFMWLPWHAQEMAQFEGGNFDPAALANGRYLPVESPMPGTTLGFIPLRAFAAGGTLFGECFVCLL
jgi:hypothetical protein